MLIPHYSILLNHESNSLCWKTKRFVLTGKTRDVNVRVSLGPMATPSILRGHLKIDLWHTRKFYSDERKDFEAEDSMTNAHHDQLRQAMVCTKVRIRKDANNRRYHPAKDRSSAIRTSSTPKKSIRLYGTRWLAFTSDQSRKPDSVVLLSHSELSQQQSSRVH